MGWQSREKEAVVSDAEKVSVAASLSDLAKRISKHAEAVQAVEEAQQQELAQVKKVDWSLVEHKNEVRQLKDNQNLLQRELAPSFHSFRREAATKLDAQAFEVRKAHTAVQEQQKLIEATDEKLQSLGADVSVLREQLATLGASQEAQTKSMLGLSRGFEDTYRHVILGENGMLPPKGKPPPMGMRPASALARVYSGTPHRPTGSAPPKRPSTAGAILDSG